MVMISLGWSWVGRTRWRCPEVSNSWCQVGANCCQKSSTEQKSSSILIVEPPGDTHWVSSLLYLTRNGSLSRTHVNLFAKLVRKHPHLAPILQKIIAQSLAKHVLKR